MNNFSPDEIKNMMSRTKTQYEVERKLLLKKVPEIFLANAIQLNITNFYLSTKHPSGPTQARIRLQEEAGVTKIIKTHKTPAGLNYALQESEVELTASEFEKYIPHITRYIQKIRYKLNVHDQVWEIDEFKNINLVVAELELCAPNAMEAKKLEKTLKEMKVPGLIKQHLIAEVTGDIQFSNLSLSEPIDDSVNDLLLSVF